MADSDRIEKLEQEVEAIAAGLRALSAAVGYVICAWCGKQFLTSAPGTRILRGKQLDSGHRNPDLCYCPSCVEVLREMVAPENELALPDKENR